MSKLPNEVSHDPIISINFSEVEAKKQQVLVHPLFQKMDSLEHYKIFMKYHVFAVWDFMNLLKMLQKHLTCVEVPWFPVGNALTRRLINDIVLGEETDEVKPGVYLSHYELYHQAMDQLGADYSWMAAFEKSMRQSRDLEKTLGEVKLPETIQTFLRTHWEIIQSKDLVQVAAGFTLGREDLIPEMFPLVIDSLAKQDNPAVSDFKFYLERHVELDGDTHGPLAMKLLAELIQGDAQKHQQAVSTAIQALEARNLLWDGVLAEIEEQQEATTAA